MHSNLRLLVEGFHFGEISLFQNCKRTCTVISKNYTTLAYIRRLNLNGIIVEIPRLKRAFIKHIVLYRDPNKKFIIQVLLQITLFQMIYQYDKHIFTDIIYDLEKKTYEPGQIIL